MAHGGRRSGTDSLSRARRRDATCHLQAREVARRSATGGAQKRPRPTGSPALPRAGPTTGHTPSSARAFCSRHPAAHLSYTPVRKGGSPLAMRADRHASNCSHQARASFEACDSSRRPSSPFAPSSKACTSVRAFRHDLGHLSSCSCSRSARGQGPERPRRQGPLYPVYQVISATTSHALDANRTWYVCFLVRTVMCIR